MGQPAAKQGDQAVGVDTHVVMVPSPPGSPVPTPLPHPFAGILDTDLSADVKIEGRAAAMVNSVATNTPPHVPTPPGVSFQSPPDNKGPVSSGSTTVFINGRGAARSGDPVASCGGSSTVIAASTVLIG
jgi:uncharacterized Zn-binding protein involved in type VI secretion